MNELSPSPNNPLRSARLLKLSGLLFELFLVILICTGIFYRFNWVNWNLDTNLHPDEYGLTNTLTQLSIPKTMGDYFNTRVSTISPYQKYDLNGVKTLDGPDNRMRWGQLPITILRWAGEVSGNTGYGEIRLFGRKISALMDTLTLLLIFLIGLKLYGRRVGLLAAALSALAVMQIQQSHFMTVDNFGSFFTTLALFACVQISQNPPLQRSDGNPEKSVYRLSPNPWIWYVLFGAAFGMALACKINLLPVGGLVLVAAFISVADLKLRTLADLKRIAAVVGLMLALSFVSAGLAFRVSQPMSFRSSTGDTSFFSLHPNQDWVDSMQVASAESSGQGGGPPGDQWAHRTVIVFPLVNMVLWGMGLPLGLAAWLAFAWAAWQITYYGKNWRIHLLPLIWSGGYFIFMGTRWVKSVRYFLPIYPFLCLLAAWALMQLWQKAQQQPDKRKRVLQLLVSSALVWAVILGTLAWASSFVQAVYTVPHTRLQATHWIFQNIPAPFHLGFTLPDGSVFNQPLGAADNLQFNSANPFKLSFTAEESGTLNRLTIPHAFAANPNSLRVIIASDPDGLHPLSEANIPVNASGDEVSGNFAPIPLKKDEVYFLIASSLNEETITIKHVMITAESWDESLPVPFEGRDPFGSLYNGQLMQIRWQDDKTKRDEMLNTLSTTDYLIIPSQRAIWASCRIPMTFPMTMAYYRALFTGKLGFSLVAEFSAPFKLGNLWVSDLAGTASLNKPPTLPIFNHSPLSAEEAFSVYDHPPVWIFKKQPDFSLDKVKAVLDSVDLSAVVVQSAFTATGDWCPAR